MGRVLIIDKQDSAAGLTRVLKSLGHTVAGSGEPGTEAILMVRRLLPDIVLMAADVGGRIDGVDTAGLIQEGFETPVVLLIERGDMQSVLRAEEAGICGYCMKPVKKKDLGTAIETALKRRNVEKHFKRQYGELLDNTYDLIHIQDDRGIITFVNSAVTQALGYEYDEIVGKNLKTFITPETYRFLKDRFGTEPKEGGVETYEIQVYDKRGNVRTFETRRRVVRVGDRIVEVQGISRDITERKRTERQLVLLGRLREQLLGTHCLSEKLKFITDGIIEAFGAELARIWILKPGDRCDAGCVHELVRSGPNVCYDRNRCLHLQASSGLYTHTDGAFHGRVPFDCCKIGRIASGSDQRFLTNDVTNDELLRDRAWAEELGLVSFAGYRLLSAEGEPIGVMALFSRQSLSHEEDTLLEDLAGTAAQIIQASRIEENLRKSEERYRILFENAMLGIYHALPDGRLMRVNAALARILDYDSPGEMISSVGNITQVYMESENRGKLLAAIAKKSGWGTFEECFRRKDGSPVFVRLHVSMVYGPDNVFEYSEGFVEDITEKIQVEQERKEAQEAIRRDRELKDKILQTAAVGIAFAENRKITWANTAMEDIFGFTDTSQYVGKETSILYASEKEYGRIGKLVYEGIGSGEIIETVARFRRTDTTEFLGLVRVSFVNPDDPFREIVVSISDITQRAEMEQALRESEQRYRLLAENADDIIFTMDTNLAFTYISPSVTRVRGFTVQEAMAQTLAEALTPDSMKVGIEAFRNGMKLETDRPERRVQMQVLELEETCKDGSTVWTETTFSVLRDEDGVFTGLLGITRDISQRKQAEERIRILVELLDIVPASITVHNLSGRFLYANRHTLDMHGYTQEEFFALTPGDIDVPEGGHLVVPDDRIQTEEGETSFDVEHYRKDGTKIPMIVNARIASWEGDPVVLSVAIDISERKRAETALEESEEKYRIVVENAYEGIAIIQDEVFVFANAKLLNIFGYEEKEFIGKPFTDLVIPKDHREAESEYQRKIGGDEFSYISAIRAVTKTGDVLLTEINGVQIIWEGRPALLVFVRDVTESKKIEQALIQNEAKYRELMEKAIDLIFIVDPDGNFLEVNESLLQETGYSKKDLLSLNFRNFVHPDDIDTAMTAYKKGREGNSHEFEMRARRKDATYGWYSFIMRPILTVDGSVEYVHNIARNITDRKAAQEALVESEQKFRGMFETSRDFMYISTLDGKIIDYSMSAKDFFGYSEEEIKKNNLTAIYADPNEGERLVERLVREGFIENHEMKLKKKDGTLIDALITATVRRDRKGNIIGFQGTARDVTQMKRMERQLLQAEKLSGLGTMISGVAHEINNPLTAIMGNAELMLMNDSVAPRDRKSLEIIMKESERAAKIVSGLLTFAREHLPERRMININDSIMEAYRLREYSLRVSNITAELLLSDDLPPTFADPHQLQQVFANILNNARDALIEVGGGTLTIRTMHRDGNLCIEFGDDGPGIEPEDMKKIFDPFFTTKDIGKGTGLGLSVAYGIVKEHNGKITADSQPGKGTTFVIELPIVSRTENSLIGDTRTVRAAPKGKSVLVVDDEMDILEFLSRALREDGYLVQVASTAQDAVSLIEKRAFDVIVVDIKMPGMGGKELHEYITGNMPQLAEKILFITGDILSDETQAFLKTTGNRCIEKPFKINQLVLTIDQLAGM